MKFSQELTDKIQLLIDQFVSNSEPPLASGEKSSDKRNLQKIVLELNVLLIKPDWFSYWGIQPDGNVIYFDIEKPYNEKIVNNQKIINMIFYTAVKNFPELKELMPVRNPESIVCPGCDGTGIPKEFAHHEILSKGIACNCGGVGWLPSADEKYLYF